MKLRDSNTKANVHAVLVDSCPHIHIHVDLMSVPCGFTFGSTLSGEFHWILSQNKDKDLVWIGSGSYRVWSFTTLLMCNTNAKMSLRLAYILHILEWERAFCWLYLRCECVLYPKSHTLLHKGHLWQKVKSLVSFQMILITNTNVSDPPPAPGPNSGHKKFAEHRLFLSHLSLSLSPLLSLLLSLSLSLLSLSLSLSSLSPSPLSLSLSLSPLSRLSLSSLSSLPLSPLLSPLSLLLSLLSLRSLSSPSLLSLSLSPLSLSLSLFSLSPLSSLSLSL